MSKEKDEWNRKVNRIFSGQGKGLLDAGELLHTISQQLSEIIDLMKAQQDSTEGEGEGT